MPRSFSRMAIRSGKAWTLRSRKRGKVIRSATASSGEGGLGVAQIGLDHGGIGADLFRRSLGDLLSHVEDGHPHGDVHHHAHVVLDEDDGGAPFLVDVDGEASYVLLL